MKTTAAHFGCMTNLTRTWHDKRERDMTNRKPYRTKANKALAAKHARKTEYGNFRCSVPVEFHARAKSRVTAT